MGYFGPLAFLSYSFDQHNLVLRVAISRSMQRARPWRNGTRPTERQPPIRGWVSFRKATDTFSWTPRFFPGRVPGRLCKSLLARIDKAAKSRLHGGCRTKQKPLAGLTLERLAMLDLLHNDHSAKLGNRPVLVFSFGYWAPVTPAAVGVCCASITFCKLGQPGCISRSASLAWCGKKRVVCMSTGCTSMSIRRL